MAQNNQAPGEKHGIEALRDPQINTHTDLTGSIENKSMDHTYLSRLSKVRRTLVARLLVLAVLTLPLAACNAVAASTTSPSPAVPIGSPTAIATITPPTTG